jgi:hypothetical protein
MAKFQPGRSGNPKGRPKGARNLATQFLEEVNAPATGKAMSNLQAAIKAQVARAIAGDVRAVKDMLDRVWKLELERSAALDRAINFGEADREVIGEIHRRLGLPADAAATDPEVPA